MRTVSGILLPFCLLTTGCGWAQTGASRVDPVLATLVPSDTIMLAGIRMDVVRTTPLYQKMVSQQRLQELNDFAAKTNFDPRKDVSDMLIASNGSEVVVLARGTFKIVNPPGTRKSSYKNWTLYGKADGAYAVLDQTTAVAGTEAAVRKAIDQKQSGKPGVPWLVDHARAITLPGQIWAVTNGWGTLPEMIPVDGNLANLRRFLRAIESSTTVADLRSGLVAAINGNCKTEQDARTLSDAARGMVGLGRLSVPEKQPELLRVFDGIKVDQKQKAIQVNIQIPQNLLDQLLKMTQNPGGPPRRP